MKKLLVVILVLFGGAMFVKNYVSITRDNQIQVASWTFPIPAAIQNSPVMGYVNTMVLGRLGTSPVASANARPGVPAPPPLPIVTSGTSTFDANRSSAGSPQGAPQFDSTARALSGSR